MSTLIRFLAVIALALPAAVHASPLTSLYGDDFGADFNETRAGSTPVLESRQNRVELRIMPLGASIMEGLKSSTHAG